MEPRVIARYPRNNSWAVLILLGVALYVCLDMKFFHQLHIIRNPELDSAGFLGFCAMLAAITAVVGKQVLCPTSIFIATSSGLELNYCFYRPRMRIPWHKVVAIKTGKHVFTFPSSGGKGGGGSHAQLRDAVEFFFDQSVDLGLLGEALAHPESRHAILIGDYLFIQGFNDALDKLRLLHPVGFSPTI